LLLISYFFLIFLLLLLILPLSLSLLLSSYQPGLQHKIAQVLAMISLQNQKMM